MFNFYLNSVGFSFLPLYMHMPFLSMYKTKQSNNLLTSVLCAGTVDFSTKQNLIQFKYCFYYCSVLGFLDIVMSQVKAILTYDHI